MITSKIESQGNRYTRNIQKILEFPFLENSITNSYVQRKIDKSFSRDRWKVVVLVAVESGWVCRRSKCKITGRTWPCYFMRKC